MPTHKPTFRIFLSSPGDVAAERKIAREVLEALNNDPFVKGKAVIEAVAWDAPGSRVLMPVSLTPQQAIDQKLAKPSETDAVFVLFWGRMGTPLDVQNHGTKPDGNPYLSGTEWEYWDAVQGSKQHPSKLPIVMVYRRTDEPIPPLQKDFQTVKLYLEALEEYAAQLRRVDTFFEQFRDATTHAYKGSVIEYANPDDFREKFTQDARLLINELLSLQGQSDSATQPTAKPTQIDWQGSPFPGLLPFTEKDELIFFGRSVETADLIKRLSTQRLMFVVGASGSGKSSLVGAGVIPQLKRGAIYGVAGWHVVRFTPGDAPFKRLSSALIKALPALKNPIADDDERTEQLADVLQKSPDKLVKQVEKWLADEPKGTELLLFVDQFEELFTTTPEAERSAFAVMLSMLSPQIRIIATMRSDFYDRALHYFEQTLRDASYTLGIPSPIALYQMITRPAEATGLQFEDGLAEKLVEDTSRQAGALALMAYTLDELYKIVDARQDRRMTWRDYEELGGVQGAIGKRAEQTFQSLELADKEAILGQVFRDLVEVDERGTATRRRTPQNQFDEAEMALIQAFTSARLLVMDDPEVEVAHEALFRTWERLKNWIAETQEDLILLRQMRYAAYDWKKKKDHEPDKNFDYLRWPQERLTLVYTMQKRLQPSLEKVEEDFIEAEDKRLMREINEITTGYKRRRWIGERLAIVGDTRTGIRLTELGLPQIDWLSVSLGGKIDIEGITFDVKSLYIAKFLITFRHFQSFVDAQDGFRDSRWWEGMPEVGHKQELPIAVTQYDNYPRGSLSWFHCIAFTRWLDYKYRENGLFEKFTVVRNSQNPSLEGNRTEELNPDLWQIRIPTEWEWQWVAQGGTASLEYPWGLWDKYARANTSESGIGDRFSAVGMFPHGVALCGAHDMAGNLWEWCLNNFSDILTINLSNVEEKTLRGGSYVGNSQYHRTSHRGKKKPDSWNRAYGMRLVCAVPIQL